MPQEFNAVDTRRVVEYMLGKRVAIAGDLREPITLCRSTRTPNMLEPLDDEFVQSLKPYRNAWAAVALGTSKSLEGTSVDPAALSYFVIRYDPTLRIEERDFLSYDNDLYRVLMTQILAKQKDFIKVCATYYARMDVARFSTGVVRDSVAGSAPVPAPDPANSSDVFWQEIPP